MLHTGWHSKLWIHMDQINLHQIIPCICKFYLNNVSLLLENCKHKQQNKPYICTLSIGPYSPLKRCQNAHVMLSNFYPRWLICYFERFACHSGKSSPIPGNSCRWLWYDWKLADNFPTTACSEPWPAHSMLWFVGRCKKCVQRVLSTKRSCLRLRNGFE